MRFYSLDTVCLHELPRRVLVRLPHSKVTFSDYLFPGEGSNEIQISLQELLDIQGVPMDSIQDIEGQAGMCSFMIHGNFV